MSKVGVAPFDADHGGGRVTTDLDTLRRVVAREATVLGSDVDQLLSEAEIRHVGAVERRHRGVRYERRSNTGGCVDRKVKGLHRSCANGEHDERGHEQTRREQAARGSHVLEDP